EWYNQAPAIYFKDFISSETILVYQSNEDLLEYDFGHSKTIVYNNKNNKLYGSLFYPANFYSTKSYPLIVNVYEKKSRDIRKFVPPSFFEITGFNLLKYLTNDYFVLYPDITYEWENPGISAEQCVLKAI